MNEVHFIAKMKELWSISAIYVAEKLEQEQIPIPKNHLPLFLTLPKNGKSITFRQLLTELKMSKSSLSDMLTKYEAMELIKKVESDEDKRSILVSLTPNATPIVEKIEDILDELTISFFKGFTENEKDVFQQSLNKALINFKNTL